MKSQQRLRKRHYSSSLLGAIQKTRIPKRLNARAHPPPFNFVVVTRHQNIVRCYGSATRDNTMSIFLEYMPGGSVRRLLDRFGEFEEKITRIYAAQMMRGLEFLHRNGVAHRDIKVRYGAMRRCPLIIIHGPSS